MTSDKANEGAGIGGTARLNEQLSYIFDAAGNLNYRTNNTLTENFLVNSVNELTANTNGGTLTVMGTTTSRASSVTVNATTASLYSDATFAAPGLALTTNYTATALDSLGRRATNTVTVSIANAAYQYDGNGNLTNDGLRSFAYDNENQLIQVLVSNQYCSQFAYDGKMRRRIRQEFAWQGSTWVLTNTVYYVYDGNEVLQERNVNNLPTTTYTRGRDLSGSLEGAGGIGGLLARTSQAYADGPLAGESYYHADANGNVTMLINSSNAIVATYLYDAFGNTISKSGLLADANLYRFSSKEIHPNSGLVYYLYRYYDPDLQRWPNRDPIAEYGGINLYGYMCNDAVDNVDPIGHGLAPGAGIPIKGGFHPGNGPWNTADTCAILIGGALMCPIVGPEICAAATAASEAAAEAALAAANARVAAAAAAVAAAWKAWDQAAGTSVLNMFEAEVALDNAQAELAAAQQAQAAAQAAYQAAAAKAAQCCR